MAVTWQFGLETTRTQETIDEAMSARKRLMELIKGGGTLNELTDRERQALEAGALYADTINRIEGAVGETASELLRLGYNFGGFTQTGWGDSGVFTADDFERIFGAVRRMSNGFLVKPTTPPVPLKKYTHYNSFNALEQNISDMRDNIEFIINNAPLCGETVCG